MLKSASKRSRTAEDLNKYREQRKKVSDLEIQLMCVYFRNNPGKEEFWLPLLAMEAAVSGRNHCDVCETGFESEAALFHHEENDHEICGLEGCTVTGSAIILEEHALLIYSSGLYRTVLPVGFRRCISKKFEMCVFLRVGKVHRLTGFEGYRIAISYKILTMVIMCGLYSLVMSNARTNSEIPSGGSGMAVVDLAVLPPMY